MKLFWTCFGVDGVIFAVLFYFFLIGLGDGTVSSFNIAIWLPLIAVPAAVLLGGMHLKRLGRLRVAKLLLGALAVPGALLGAAFLFVIIMFATHPGAHH